MAQAQIEVPAGMDPAQVQKLFASFIKTNVQTKVRDKARAAAAKKLREKYADEYEKLVAANMPK